MYFMSQNMNSKVFPGEETAGGEMTYITMWKLLLEFYIEDIEECKFWQQEGLYTRHLKTT